MNNIAKHAKASLVEIDIAPYPFGIGAGISAITAADLNQPDLIPFGHYGLNMMKERAEAVGAELCITEPPETGD